jgi:5S rRNA maturation endonuclease (ribonuclease M5)
MNSISLLNRTKEYLQNYSEIQLFLDNDKPGENCKNSILESFPEAKNHSEIYALHKDLNDYFVFRNNTKIEKQQRIELNPKQEQEEIETNQAHPNYKRKR